MKTFLCIFAAIALAAGLSSAHAQDEPGKTAAEKDPVVTVNTKKDVAIVAKDVRDIIGFGGRISVKDSRAKVLGGAAGDVETENASFGTVVLAAGSVDMNGGSVGELKIAAGRINLNIDVTGDGDLAGGEIALGKNMSVAGDMDILAGSVDLDGRYSGNLTIDAESVVVAGDIGGDLKISARRIKIAPDTKIGGDLRAPNLLNIPDSVIVGGEKRIGTGKSAKRLQREGATISIDSDRGEAAAKLDEAAAKLDEATAKIDDALENVDINSSIKDAIKKAARDKAAAIHDDGGRNDDDIGLISPQPMGMGAWLTVLVTLAVCGTLALGIAPQFIVRATERLAKEPLPSLGVGLLSVVAVPAALIAVGITIIGIPFAILGAAAYAIGIGLGLIALCLWGGLMVRTLAHQPGQETRVPKLVGWTLMGFLALALIGAIPVVGRVIQILAIMTGAGAVLATAWAARRKENPPLAS